MRLSERLKGLKLVHGHVMFCWLMGESFKDNSCIQDVEADLEKSASKC